MKIPYKYKIGQTVKIINDKNHATHWGRDEYLAPFINKEVTIIERGFELEDISDKFKAGYGKKVNFLDKYHLTIYYYINIDPWIEHLNNKDYISNVQLTRINETCLSGEETSEPFEEEFKTNDNYDIEISNTKVLEHLIGKFVNSDTWKTYEEVNCRFTFASYGTVIGVRKNYELRANFKELYQDYQKCTYEVETFREFLCFYEPRKKDGAPTPCHDSACYGNKHWVYIDDIWKELPENFVERYVNDALNRPFHKQIKYNPFNDWSTVQWLKKLEIYDEVKQLFDNQKPQAIKEKEKKDKAINAFVDEAKKYLAGLTEEQKEKLKELL